MIQTMQVADQYATPRVFKEIIVPLFESLETVHDFYYGLFLENLEEILAIG